MFTLLLYALCTYIIYHFLFSDVDIDELGAEKDSIGDDDDDDGDDDDVVVCLSGRVLGLRGQWSVGSESHIQPRRTADII